MSKLLKKSKDKQKSRRVTINSDDGAITCNIDDVIPVKSKADDGGYEYKIFIKGLPFYLSTIECEYNDFLNLVNENK